MMWRRYMALLTLVALPASAVADDMAGQAVTGAHGLTLPASFSGVLPCADCPGIRHHLDLWPGGGYALRREYIDRDQTIDALGRWHVDPSRSALVLTGTDPIEWQILGNGHLRLLDSTGQPIESDLPYGLEPGPLAPFDLALPMTGEFVYFADAALFTECMTGQRFPVGMEGDYLALERAYLDARAAPRAPLLARIDGRIAEAAQMEGPPRRSVTVERLHHVTPGGACATARAPAELLNTFWRILEIDDTDPPAEGVRREPHLLLLSGDERRFAATAGCNTMLGSFEQDGAALGFGRVASTMMACPPEIAAFEAALTDLLGAVTGYDSDGRILRLRDGEGRVRAQLEAAYMPHH